MISDPLLSAETRIWPIPPEPSHPQAASAAKSRLWPVQAVISALLCAGVIFCRLCVPAATEVLSDLLIGTGESRLRTAAACFEASLDEGDRVGDAISVFCETFIAP